MLMGASQGSRTVGFDGAITGCDQLGGPRFCLQRMVNSVPLGASAMKITGLGTDRLRLKLRIMSDDDLWWLFLNQLVRWLRYDVIVLDEVGYVPLAEIGAEFLFQVIAERAERAALIVTTNLPFSEWTQVFSNPRLCKALLDRITDRAHIIETGTESYRFRRTLEVRQKKKVS